MGFDLRITRAFRTAHVLTLRTIRCSSHEESITHMACSAYSLHWRPSLHLFSGHPRSQCQGYHDRIVIDRDCHDLFLPILCLCWVSRTLLAPCMLAVTASLVRAESRLAAMTCSVNAHANFLLDSFGVGIDWRRPLTRSQCQPILGEQHSSLFLLYCATGSSSSCQPCIGWLCARLEVPNRLLKGGRNRRCHGRRSRCFRRNGGRLCGSRCLCGLRRITNEI